MVPTAHEKIGSFIRTKVAYLVGAFLGWLLVTTGLDLTGQFQLTTIALVVALVTLAYYQAVRLVETRFPGFGVLLGFPRQPDYVGSVSNLWQSLVKTAVPVLVTFLVALGIDLISNLFGVQMFSDPETQLTLIAVLIGVAEAAYDSAAKAIIAKWPAAAWLLGGQDAAAPLTRAAYTKAA